MFIAIEAGLTGLAVVLAFAAPKLGWRWFEAIESSFGKLARLRTGMAQAYLEPEDSISIRPSQSERDLMRNLSCQ